MRVNAICGNVLGRPHWHPQCGVRAKRALSADCSRGHDMSRWDGVVGRPLTANVRVPGVLGGGARHVGTTRLPLGTPGQCGNGPHCSGAAAGPPGGPESSGG